MRASFIISMHSRRDSGVTFVISSAVMVCRIRGGGLTGKGCVGQASSPGTRLGGTFLSSISKTNAVKPSTTPVQASFIPRAMTSLSTSPCCAPSAIRSARRTVAVEAISRTSEHRGTVLDFGTPHQGSPPPWVSISPTRGGPLPHPRTVTSHLLMVARHQADLVVPAMVIPGQEMLWSPEFNVATPLPLLVAPGETGALRAVFTLHAGWILR